MQTRKNAFFPPPGGKKDKNGALGPHGAGQKRGRRSAAAALEK